MGLEAYLLVTKVDVGQLTDYLVRVVPVSWELCLCFVPENGWLGAL